MMRLRGFWPSSDKILKIQLHPTHPWLVTADASDRVSVWNWEHRQIIYELKAGGVDERRLVGVKLEKLAEGDTESRGKSAEAIRGGSVKQVNFYDDDVQYWQLWQKCSAASEATSAVKDAAFNFSSPVASTKGRHFVVICCENKAIFLDLVTMRSRDIPKQDVENKAFMCMEFICKYSGGDGPLVAFGGSDGVIRVVSMITWKLFRWHIGAHKGAVSCLLTFMSSSFEELLVSGGSDGLLALWSANYDKVSKEIVPRLCLKAHDGAVVAVKLARVVGHPPHLLTVGTDKTLAIWDTSSFREIRRLKPVPKLACHSVSSWCHPRAPNLDILVGVKDSYIWAVEHSTHSPFVRPLCEISSLLPSHAVSTGKKLRVYCIITHQLQPHLVVTGTNIGVILCEFDARSLPAVLPLPMSSEDQEHSAVYAIERELKLLNFQLKTDNPTENGVSGEGAHKIDSELLHIKQSRKRISTPITNDAFSVLALSSSGRYMSIVWPDIPYFTIYKINDWSVIDSGSARLLAWDICQDRFAILESAMPPRLPIIAKVGSSRKAKEAAAAAAQAAMAAATAASTAAIQVRILLDDGSSNVLVRSVGGHTEPVIGLHGGSLLGVAYRASRRSFSSAETTVSTTQSVPFSGFGDVRSQLDDGYTSHESADSVTGNFQLYSWETFQPIGSLLPQPHWTAWDQTVEFVAFAYQNSIVISSLRPQFRYVGDVSIPYATGGIWHRRQLFVVTPTTIECVFVDAGVTTTDVETLKMKEEMIIREAQAKAIAEHGDLALITVDRPQPISHDKVKMRPPMLQVVRLASFQHASALPPFITLPKQYKTSMSNSFSRDQETKGTSDTAASGCGLSMAVSRFPEEQKRPIGPLVIVGVRDGVLWLIDRYISPHALSLSHPGIRCRCLAASGDPVSAVKWASRLGREHHDDLAEFMLGMGFATEALHLPGISKRLEFQLAIQSNDLSRALQCLLTMSNSLEISKENAGFNLLDALEPSAKKENLMDVVLGVGKFSKEFLELVDAADATAHSEIAHEALQRLAAAAHVSDVFQAHDIRGVALRLASHGEMTKLTGLVNSLISRGLGREAAFAASVLGDNALMEKAWQSTGMLAEAVLHAHAHGRPTLKNLVKEWNKALQKELESSLPTSSVLNSLDRLPNLSEAAVKPEIEILPPGMPPLSFTSNKVQAATKQSSMQQPSAQPILQLEAPPPATAETAKEPNPEAVIDAPKPIAPKNSELEDAKPAEADSPEPNTNLKSGDVPEANITEEKTSDPVDIVEKVTSSLPIDDFLA